ncbi:hypothetical protein [Thermomonas sp.]
MQMTFCRNALLIACLLLATVAQAHSAVAPQVVKVDDSLVGALIEAIVRQLDGRAVEVKLDAVSQQGNGLGGTGKLRIEGENEWMGFRFRLPQDYRTVGVGDAGIEIGGIATDERNVPNDPRLLSLLESEILAALSKGSAQTALRLQLDRIETLEAGKSYRRINTTGVADFGREGTRPIRIEALYDQHKNVWLYTRYWLDKRDE